jgi:hypothetical protein
MTPEDFVDCIREEVLRANLASYDGLLAKAPEKVRDPIWHRIVVAYAPMTDEQKQAMRTLVRQVLVDTISNLFGILDGSSILDRYRDEFSLTYGPAPDKLNGDLQSSFLAKEEG